MQLRVVFIALLAAILACQATIDVDSQVAESNIRVLQERKVSFTEVGRIRQKRGFLDDLGKELESGITGVAKSALEGVADVVKGFIGGLFGDKEAEAAERRHREQMEMQLQEFCTTNCLSEWSQWSMCSEPCGGGTMNRTRRSTIPSRCPQGFSCNKVLEQSAPCNPGCPNNGISNGNGCTCPDGFTGKCCQQRVQCIFPGRPSHGQIDGTFPANFGSVASFSCSEGYSLEGEMDIICDQSGGWSSTKPFCNALQCKMPHPPDNGDILNKADLYSYGQEIHYICDEGYTMIGPNFQTCSKINEVAAWSDFTPLCKEADCGDPGYPLYGNITGVDFSLGGTVTISCFPGFRLTGSKERTCLSSGKWSGHTPQCEAITCEAPLTPRYGTMSPSKDIYYFGSSITFSCEEGYDLEGKSRLRCREDSTAFFLGGGGAWDADPPTCRAVMCGDPGVPQFGSKDGSLYFHPHNVSFSCFAGYTLQGESQVHCDKSGVWTSAPPSCIACPVGTYKENTQLDSPCEPCPPNSHTTSAGSTNRAQCICQSGFKKDSNGECQEIQCPQLSAPEFGSLKPCENKFGSVCEITCNDGYVIFTGAARRQCLEDGEWSGTDPVCRACPINTFKADERVCIPCPVHSHTSAEAQMESGCICDAGYQGNPGGPCTDVDECLDNDGRGSCQETCKNTDGSYECACNIPGYIIDPNDRNSCIVSETCRNLTSADAPANGGLVCHWYHEHNSQQCSVRCNQGYEFPSRVNIYETCGQSTGYQWSHEERGEIFEPCIEELIPDFHYEADSFYFVRACKDLTPAEQEEVKQTFADMLNNEGVCLKGTTKLCDIKDIGIICGETTRRRKRDVDGLEHEEEVSKVKIKMGVYAHKAYTSKLDCDRICTMLRIPGHRCSALCEPVYKRFLKAAAIYSQQQLKKLYETPQNAHFATSSRDFEAEENGVQTQDVITGCEEGMVSQSDSCISCQPGTMSKNGECQKCPVGFFQPLEKQTSCLPCPVGTTSLSTGSSSCQVCPSGTYGLLCRSTCGECVHGTCDPRTGDCVCSSGWEGPACDQDIMGCTIDSCFPGAKCFDIKAPGTGFLCGPCPEGMTGDGSLCDYIPL